MSDTTGSLEVLNPDGTSEGTVVTTLADVDVPAFIDIDFAKQTTWPAGAVRAHARAEWTADDGAGNLASVIAWPAAAFDFTANGFPRNGGDGG